VTTYTLAIAPVNSIQAKIPLNGVHATKAEAWTAVQKTEYAEPVTVFEDGKPLMTFSWKSNSAEEPDPNHPGYVRRVWDLCKWTRSGWEPTGVQAAGSGKERIIRIVAT
jgi:hypothetical protein